EASKWVHHSKGKELTKEDVKSPDRLPTMRELCDQLYEAPSEELMDRVAKSVVWGLHFVGALIDRLYDAGRVVHLLTKKISVLRAKNKELRSGVGPKAVVAIEKRAIELSAKVERLKAALGESK
ncbi:hypothetical protein B296_00020890, partial [Ensete ventricosum]